MVELTREKALIFRIVHRDNLAWILTNGLHCRSSGRFDPRYVEIGNADLIGKRATRLVPCFPGGSLSDYIPFYFTPSSPMLLNIRTGRAGVPKLQRDEIAILVSSLPALVDRGVNFVFTDRHAYLSAAQFYSDLQDLARIDWRSLQMRDFKRDPDDPAKFERYQAEALVYGSLPCAGLLGIACYDQASASIIERLVHASSVALRVVVRPDWFF